MAVEKALLHVEGIDAYYGRSQALFGVSFEVGRREFVAIVGRNGAGKTTTLRAIMGLNRVRSGAISFEFKPDRQVEVAPDRSIRKSATYPKPVIRSRF